MSEQLLLDRNTFLTRFGASDPDHRALRTLHQLIAGDEATIGEGAVDWLEALVDWVFTRGALPGQSAEESDTDARARLLSTCLDELPGFAARLASTVQRVLSGSSATLLFADTGIATRVGFWSELADRFTRNVLPAPPVGREVSRLLARLIDTPARVEWVVGLDPTRRERWTRALGLDSQAVHDALEPGRREAMVLLATRIATQGSNDDVRKRARQQSAERSPFLALPVQVPALLAGMLETQPVLDTIAACQQELALVTATLDETGISIDLVYRLELLSMLLARLTLLVQLRAKDDASRGSAREALTSAILRGSVADRSLQALLQSSTRLLARRFVERAGTSGEHYVTRTRTEQQAMLDAAAGGGAITALAVFSKFFISYLHAPPVFDALLIGLNYAWCFVAMQLLHFALATKQPSMTAATIAGAIEAHEREGSEQADLEPLVDLVTRASRTQFAALVGNVFVVVPFALCVGLVFQAVVGHHVLDDAYAEKTIKVHHPIHSVTIFSAAMTGVWLWAASLLAGAGENWFVLHELPGALASNRFLRRTIGPARTAKVSRFLTEQASGFGGNVGFAMLLGFMPMLFGLVGIPLEVRHVTFVTGQLVYAALQLGPQVFARPDFLLALLSIPMVGLINFGVSFAFAIVVALRARGLGVRSQLTLLRATARRFVKNPSAFFLAPKERDDENQPAPMDVQRTPH